MLDLSSFKKQNYTPYETPLERAHKLELFLGKKSPKIYIKRDDMLGLTGGGNKTRKLEFLMADAIEKKATAIITCGAIQSNHCRLTLAAAIRENCECHLVLEERIPNTFDQEASGNNFLFQLLGATSTTLAKKGENTQAKTIKTAINPKARPQDISSPGHVFPLQAKDGGVLVRAGHTEAAIDISRLAGLNPSGVICEIMNDDGTMARLPDLLKFSAKHGLKVGTIADLIAYRRKNDNLVRQISSTAINLVNGGEWVLKVFEDQIGKVEHIVLIKGKTDPRKPIMVRMHGLNIYEDVLGSNKDRYGLLPNAMKQIAINGTGVIVLLQNMGKQENIDDSGGQILRQYGIGAQILLELGIGRINLLSNSPAPKVIGLEGYKLKIESCIPILEDHNE